MPVGNRFDPRYLPGIPRDGSGNPGSGVGRGNPVFPTPRWSRKRRRRWSTSIPARWFVPGSSRRCSTIPSSAASSARALVSGPAPERKRIQNSLGSGVIVGDSNGTIITNHHVIEGADEITVVLADRREFEASVRRHRREDRPCRGAQVDDGGEPFPYPGVPRFRRAGGGRSWFWPSATPSASGRR